MDKNKIPQPRYFAQTGLSPKTEDYLLKYNIMMIYYIDTNIVTFKSIKWGNSITYEFNPKTQVINCETINHISKSLKRRFMMSVDNPMRFNSNLRKVKRSHPELTHTEQIRMALA